MAKITVPPPSGAKRKIHHDPKLAQLTFLDRKAEILIWFLLAILFFLLSLLSWYYRPTQVQDLITQSDRAFTSGDYQASYTFLNKAVLLDNSNPDIHFKLSQTYEATNNWPEARKELLLALELSPTATINKELAKVNTTINEPGRIKGEINFWEKETITKPDYRDAYLQLAVRYYQIYRADLAKQNLLKAYQLDPNFEITKKLMEIIK